MDAVRAGETGGGAAPPRPLHPVAFVDASAIVALVDRDDATHEAAVEAYRSLVASGYKLFTTNHAVVEAYNLLCTGVGPDVARQWLREMRLAIYHAAEEDEAEARRRAANARGRRMLSLTDAISLVVMERLGVHEAFAVDAQFHEEMS